MNINNNNIVPPILPIVPNQNLPEQNPSPNEEDRRLQQIITA